MTDTQVTNQYDGFRMLSASETIAQIGKTNFLAICGGRWQTLRDSEGASVGIRLHAGAGYRVDVLLAGNDTYTVRRVYVRAGKEFVHGEETNIYCDQVGEIAYIASCYSCYTFGKKEESNE